MTQDHFAPTAWQLMRTIAAVAILVCLAGVCSCNLTRAQDATQGAATVWHQQSSGSSASLRGLSVVNAKVAWASGTGGTVLRTLDGGVTWQDVSVGDAASLDFRDIHAADDSLCVVISAGSPGLVFRTNDGGHSWSEVYRNDAPSIFFDAMSFWDQQNGIALSDPQDGAYFLIRTGNGGATWEELAKKEALGARPGEACFAASGTGMCTLEGDHVWFASGGTQSMTGQPPPFARVFRSSDRGGEWRVAETPILASESAGIFSIAFANIDHGVAVGGDYQQPESSDSNVAITDSGGENWRAITGNPPRGYRSCVAVLKSHMRSYFVAVGPTGTDLSANWGNDWHPIDSTAFHAVGFTADGAAGWAVGAEGRIAVWALEADQLPQSN